MVASVNLEKITTEGPGYHGASEKSPRTNFLRQSVSFGADGREGRQNPAPPSTRRGRRRGGRPGARLSLIGPFPRAPPRGPAPRRPRSRRVAQRGLPRSRARARSRPPCSRPPGFSSPDGAFLGTALRLVPTCRLPAGGPLRRPAPRGREMLAATNH